jgi:hypothetical protein
MMLPTHWKTKARDMVTTFLVWPAAFKFAQLRTCQPDSRMSWIDLRVHQRLENPQDQRNVVTTQQRLRLVPRYHQQTDGTTDGEEGHHSDDWEPHLDFIGYKNAANEAEDLDTSRRHLLQPSALAVSTTLDLTCIRTLEEM